EDRPILDGDARHVLEGDRRQPLILEKGGARLDEEAPWLVDRRGSLAQLGRRHAFAPERFARARPALRLAPESLRAVAGDRGWLQRALERWRDLGELR